MPDSDFPLQNSDFPSIESLLDQCGADWELDPDYLDALPARLTYLPAAYAELDGGACWYAPILPFGA